MLMRMGETPQRGRGWLLLLLLPFAGLLYPPLYNRVDPQIFGFPFFYWYQLLWVFLTTALLGLVYWRHRE